MANSIFLTFAQCNFRATIVIRLRADITSLDDRYRIRMGTAMQNMRILQKKSTALDLTDLSQSNRYRRHYKIALVEPELR